MLTQDWQKATASNPSGNCLEARWKKSSFSGPNNPDGHGCVEAQYTDGKVQVRDTKLGEASPVLEFTRAEWTAFQQGDAAGEFDLPPE